MANEELSNEFGSQDNVDLHCVGYEIQMGLTNIKHFIDTHHSEKADAFFDLLSGIEGFDVVIFVDPKLVDKYNECFDEPRITLPSRSIRPQVLIKIKDDFELTMESQQSLIELYYMIIDNLKNTAARSTSTETLPDKIMGFYSDADKISKDLRVNQIGIFINNPYKS